LDTGTGIPGIADGYVAGGQHGGVFTQHFIVHHKAAGAEYHSLAGPHIDSDTRRYMLYKAETMNNVRS
jgi:hypothetical protein